MRPWARALLVLGGLALVGIGGAVGYIEVGCRGTPQAGKYRAVMPTRRPEARTWLTYPEWHIVYSADSLGRHLAAGRPPSSYDYRGDIKSFWTSYCAVNRATSGLSGAGEAKQMIYVIGISFTVEMAVKMLWETTIGKLTEGIGGWSSPEDRWSTHVQQRYGTFMHETPWYAFPFRRAFDGLWRGSAEGHHVRHWERRVALSAEYGVKALYAKAIGAAAGLQPDDPRMRFVARTTPAQVRAIDARLEPVASQNGLTIVETPRYAQFTELLGKMARANVELVEIAGNDDIFVTLLQPANAKRPSGTQLMIMPLADRPGWHRVGVTVKVSQLLPLLRDTTARGGRVEHVYDY